MKKAILGILMLAMLPVPALGAPKNWDWKAPYRAKNVIKHCPDYSNAFAEKVERRYKDLNSLAKGLIFVAYAGAQDESRRKDYCDILYREMSNLPD